MESLPQLYTDGDCLHSHFWQGGLHSTSGGR